MEVSCIYEAEVHNITEFYGITSTGEWVIPYYSDKKGFYWQETLVCPDRVKTFKAISLPEVLKRLAKKG